MKTAGSTVLYLAGLLFVLIATAAGHPVVAAVGAGGLALIVFLFRRPGDTP